MDYLTDLLLALAVLVVGSIILKGIRDHARGTGGPWKPPIREKPSADEPTPSRSATASASSVAQARQRTPPA
jgi:hypothetical protein